MAHYMRIPIKPPLIKEIMSDSGFDIKKLQLLVSSKIGPIDDKGRYLHWDKLRHLSPPENFDSDLYWLATKNARNSIFKTLSFKDKYDNSFNFCIPDVVMRDLLWISENASGVIGADPIISDRNTKETYLINSLIEEAINSSQLEGASTTRRVAKEMIRTGRDPKSHSEKMILNNYMVMKFINEFKSDALTPSMIFELHRMLTQDTLAEEDKDKAGKLRNSSDDICVYSHDHVLLHTPPDADTLEQRLQLICDFANKIGENELTFIPPIIRAIIIHFMIGYDHPFVDGNGRTARALFYLVMAKENYWLMEYISISRVIKKAPAKYMQAYLYTETDENDMTYFIIHQLDIIKEAIADLHLYLKEKTNELREAEKVLENSSLKGLLNIRQLNILKNALKNPGAEYTIKSHKTSHDVTYQTARTDLLMLSDQYKILKKYKVGRADVFIAPPDIKELISKV